MERVPLAMMRAFVLGDLGEALRLLGGGFRAGKPVYSGGHAGSKPYGPLTARVSGLSRQHVLLLAPAPPW